MSPTLLWSFGATTVLSNTPTFVVLSTGTRSSGVVVPPLQVDPAVVGLHTFVPLVVAVFATDPVVMSLDTSV